MVPARLRNRAVVVAVGATANWFEAAAPIVRAAAEVDAPTAGGPLSVVFFGLFTPLQGSTVIGRALRLLHERGTAVRATLIGSGQDAEAVHQDVDGLPSVTWVDWVDADELPAVVAGHDVCLGIFGTTEKALRVVPNKV
ncbi:hypothetical protein [Georgenia sp. SUBG003]|uniref:hypothetical protein n=1 Tax=Georgenia sp. SUBG003 TaxID=1497974 RepID=UPI0004D8CE99|nr:hypothetical protein DA06_01455 [Georgenia sp. SUBG003]